MPQHLLTAIAAFVVGGILLLASVVFRRNRVNLAFLGLGFLALGVGQFFAWPISAIPFGLAAAFFVAAFVFAIREARRRLARFQQEQQEREAAFGEYLAEMARAGKRP